MRRVLAVALVLATTPAYANNWAVVCSSPCMASDGTTQPAGTTVNVVVWDGVTQWAPPLGTIAVPFSGQTIYAPPAPLQTLIAPEDFLNRFTAAEQVAITQIALGNGQVFLFLTKFTADTVIDVTAQSVLSGFTLLRTLNLLTASRAAQILNLGVPSP